jgi:hypothetical protein
MVLRVRSIRDNLVLGIDVSYQHGTDKNIYNGTVTDDETDNGGSLGVFVRRYQPIGAGFSLFGQAELRGNYSHSNADQPASTPALSHSNTYGFELQLYPGIAYAINHKWQLETSLPNFILINYSHIKSTEQYTGQPEQTYTSHNFGISTSLTGNNEFSVGVRYFVGG